VRKIQRLLPRRHGDTAESKAMLFAFVSRAFSPCRRVAVVKVFQDFPA
jgi:hypothetical protein